MAKSRQHRRGVWRENVQNILIEMISEEVCLLSKKRSVGGRWSGETGCSVRSDLGGQRSRRAVCSWRSVLAVGKSALSVQRSRPENKSLAVGDLLSES